MNQQTLVTNAIGIVQGLIGLFAIIMGGVAVWKIGMTFTNVDAKTAAEVGAAFAITYWCMKS